MCDIFGGCSKELKGDDEMNIVKCGYAKKAAYLQGLWIKHRMTSQDFNRQWGEQEGKCASCGKELAHPFEKGEGEGVKLEVTKRGNLFCISCNRRER